MVYEAMRYQVRIVEHCWEPIFWEAYRILKNGLVETDLYSSTGTYIVLGGHLAPKTIRPGEVIYQTERPSIWDNDFREALRTHRVLSYAPNLPGEYCPLGYVDTPLTPRDESFDVFFAGESTPHRRAVLAELRARNLRVLHSSYAFPRFGISLALAEAKAKVVLNVHASETEYFESSRVVPAVSRGALVLSEPALGAAFCHVTKDLASEALRLVTDRTSREGLRKTYLAELRTRRMSATLKGILGC